MGIGFTIDTPFKVAQYGMDSVISLVDDILLEKLRKMYSDKFEIPYKEITNAFSFLSMFNKSNHFEIKAITLTDSLICEEGTPACYFKIANSSCLASPLKLLQ